MPALVTSLFESFGARLRYLLAINGAYIAGARAAPLGAGRRGDDPPFGVAAGDGNAAEFARIRTEDYQKGVDRRAAGPAGLAAHRRAQRSWRRQPASGYVAPPRLITPADVPDGRAVRSSGRLSRDYSRIWGR
jgi:ribose transport system substrate-binding protein